MQQFKESNKLINWYIHNSDGILISFAIIDLFFWVISIVDKETGNTTLNFLWTVFISLIFAFDFSVKYLLSYDRIKYIKENWWQLIIILLPFLRASRILVLLRVFILSYRVRNNIKILLVEKGLSILIAIMIMVALAFSVLVYFAEHNSPIANITNLKTAIWWAFSTMTTVGYGDVFPVTIAGKVLAVSFMFISISLVAIFTAQFTAMVIRSDIAQDKKLEKKIERLELELKAIKQILLKQKRK